MPVKGLNLLLFTIWLALLIWVTLSYLSPPSLDDYLVTPGEVVPTESQASTPQDFEILKVPNLAQYTETIERPLFYIERRPPKEEVALPSPPTPPPPPEEESEMTLIGVLITPQATTAMVKVEDAEKTDLLKIGDKVETWQLAEIKTESVLLRKGDETKELILERNQRKPSRTPHSLRQPPPQPAAEQPADQQQNAEQTTANNQQDNQAAVDERLRLRQERLKAIAERRRQLLEQRRARLDETQKSSRRNNDNSNNDN